MAVWEILTIDGLTLTGDPTATLVLEAFSPGVAKERPEWVSVADSEGSALARTPQHENAEMTLRVRVGQQASMNAALDQIGALRDKLYKAARTPGGVTMTWAPADATRTWNTKLLTGELTDLPVTWSGDDAGWFQRRPVLPVTLTRTPYWYGTETLTSTAASSTPITTLEVTGVPGDVPALGRLIVSDTATQNRRHVEWGIENQYYNSGTSLILDSDSFVTSGFAGTGTTLSGAYDPGAAGNSVVQMNLYSNPVAMFGTGNLSHVGTFRVYARVYTDVFGAKVRFAWQDGDGPFMALPWRPVPNSGAFFEVALGPITITEKKSGTQRWTGRLEGLSANAGTLFCDYLLFIPVAEGYGKARGQWSSAAGGAVVGYDQFTGTTAGGALNARVATLGGTWATSGVASDFAFTDEFVDQSTEAVSRATTSEATPRLAILGATNYTNTGAQARIAWTGWPGGTQSGVIIRYVDSSNYLYARLDAPSADLANFELVQVVAGTATVLLRRNSVPLVSRQPVYINAAAYTTGRITAALYDTDGITQLALLDTIQTVAATGGTLQTGKPGLYDRNGGAAAASRYYDDFQVFTPPSEPIAVYSGRTLEFRHDDTIRQDSTGTYYGRPQSYNGSRFLVPPGTSRVVVKARRNDIDVDADSQVTDSTTIQVGTTPRSLVVPRS